MENMINVINRALKTYFADSVGVSDDDIGFQMPKKEWVDTPAANPKMSLYLFDIRENVELRSNEWQPVNHNNSTIKRKQPDARIDLFYMITFYSRESNADQIIEEEHQWISETLATVYSHASIPKEYFSDDEGQVFVDMPKIPAVPVHPKFLDEEGGLQLWSALDQYLKPVIYLKVTIPLSLAKYLEYAKVLAKILKFGVPGIKNYYTLNIHPPVNALVCADTCVLSKIPMTPTLNYLDADASANTDSITLINRDNIGPADIGKMVIIDDSSNSELCIIDNVIYVETKVILQFESELKYFHQKGKEIKIAKVNEADELKDIDFIEEIQPGTSQFKLIKEDTEKLKSGDLISVKDNTTTEYFFITAKFKEEIEIKEIIQEN